MSSLFRKGGLFEGGYAEGDIMIYDIILLMDKDSGVKERIIEAILPEFALDKKLAYVQCATDACNLYDNYYTYATGHQVNNLFHNIWPCKALQGFFVPLVGHNVFLRKSILDKSGFWSEDRVSEDYDKAICLYGMGYHGKYAQIKGLEFTECASRTFTEETGKQCRYAYGLYEMIFDGTISSEKARRCDVFYMLLYFCSVINQALLLPAVLFESYFGNIHFLWAGFFFCMLCFVFLPMVRGLVMRRILTEEHSEKLFYTIIIAFSFIGHAFSFLVGTCRYLANKIRKHRTPFLSTNADYLEYRFEDGLRTLFQYIRKNPLFLLLTFLCLDRGIFLLTRSGLEPLTAFTYAYILFCAVLVPVILTPQLFAGLNSKYAAVKNTKTGNLERKNGKEFEEGEYMYYQDEPTEFTGNDVERFLIDYQESLYAALPEEDIPEELLSEYKFESCLRKDPESRKELYLLRRKKDNVKALLRITKDYPEEDAAEEAKLLERLNHPGIPKVYASCEQNGKRYLVREYIEGRTLHEIVSLKGHLSANDVFGIALKLAEILCYLHMQKPPVIHRDIKPQNIIVGRDGSIHLIDFGIARVHKRERHQDTSVILTLDYASPEQYGFEQTTPLSDIYSFGVLLLFLATGNTVRFDLEAQIINNRLRNLIEQCIAFNPKERIQSARELCAYISQGNDRFALKRKRKVTIAAGMIAAVVGMSALSYGIGLAVAQDGAEKRGYEHGYETGYTEGYDAAPVFQRSDLINKINNGICSENMSVNGAAFAAQSGKSIFYISEGGIWSISANGTDRKLLVRDERARGLICYKDWLYYSSGNRIMQTNIYTQKSGVLCGERAGDIYVVDKRFYISADEGLYRLNIRNGAVSLINNLSGCKNLHTDGEKLYFLGGNNHALYRSDFDGKALMKLTKRKCRSNCFLENEFLCSVGKNGAGRLIRMNKEGGESETLLEVDTEMLNATEDGICFLDMSNKMIYRCSFDGRIRERISGNQAGDFNIAGDWVFYHNERDNGSLWCVRLDGSNDHPLSAAR